jgi:cell division septum initiation protein DivIVA
MDPRVKASADDLRAQFQAEMKIADAMHRDFQALQQVQALRGKLKEIAQAAGSKAPALLKSTDEKAALIEGTAGEYGSQYLSTPEGRSLARLNSGFNALLAVLQSADAGPTTQALAMLSELEKVLAEQLANWQQLQSQDLPALNKALKQAKLPAIMMPSADAKQSAATAGAHSHHEDRD